MKFKLTVYFVTSMQKKIINIVPKTLQHKNINERKDKNAFVLQIIKTWGSLYILTICILYILEDIITFYLSFVIIYGNRLKYIAGKAQVL